MARRSKRRRSAKHPKGYGDFGVLPFALPILPTIAAALGLTAYFVTKKKPLEQSARGAGGVPGTNIPTTGNSQVDTRQAVYQEAGIDTSGATSRDAAVRDSQLNAAVHDAAGQGNALAQGIIQDSIVAAGLVTAAQEAWKLPGTAANVQIYAGALQRLSDYWQTSRAEAASRIGLPEVKPLTTAPPPASPVLSPLIGTDAGRIGVPVVVPQIQSLSTMLPSNFFTSQPLREAPTAGFMRSTSFFSEYRTK